MTELNGDTQQGESGAGTAGSPAPWSRIEFGEPASWIDPESYEAIPNTKEGAHLTHLLWSRQVDADAGRSFHSSAVRLETALAVQHHSQWSLDLDPRTQRLILHWLRVVRAGGRIDHLHRDRMRLIQRETQLERLVIDGRWTLLVVLDDVRPGDVIEAGWSCETRHPIRPQGCEVFYPVPPQMMIGNWRVSVVFSPGRPNMAWRASADAPERREDTTSDGRRRWLWTGAQTAPRDPEPNQPGTFLDYIWIQVSDLSAWQDFASHISETWNGTVDGTDLGQFPGFARPESVDAAAVRRLVQHIQDEFRYLSVDLESGGWIPAAPGAVAKRRYGDCKDLAWLAATVLRGWGVTARPVLVGTGLRQQVAELLPMAGLFNHAVLEVEIAGKARWFDLTLRAQGGDFASQSVGWFCFGLPVAADTRALRAQPGARAQALHAVRETILLDSRRGEFSTVEQRLWMQGWQADLMRQARLAKGAAEFTKERLQQAQRRYGKVRRVGELHWRDDRERNVCELAEAFEVSDVVHADERADRASFNVPRNTILESFIIPEDKPRRTPWHMPFPIEVRHEITVKAPSMAAGSRQRRRWDEPEFTGTLDEPRPAGAWTKTARFVVNEPEISPERLPHYRRQLDEFMRATTWRIYLPWNQVRPHRGEDFGALPPPAEGVTAYVEPAATETFPSAMSVPNDDARRTAALAQSHQNHAKTRRRRRRVRSVPPIFIRLAMMMVVFIIFGILHACSGPRF